MAEGDRSATIQLPPVGEGNEVFRQAVACIRLAGPLAGHLVRDRLHLQGVDIRQVTVADISAIVAELEGPIAALADDAAVGKASVEALRRFVADHR